MVVAMMGILMAVGVPTFRAIITTNELADITNDLVLSLKRARAEAITSGRRVIVCSSADLTAAEPSCTGVANQWEEGWMIFVDWNQDNAFDTANGDRLVWVKQVEDNTTVTITGSPFGALTNDFTSMVVFSHTGELLDGTAGGFRVCSGDVTGDPPGYPRRDISVTVAGDANMVRNTDTANDC